MTREELINLARELASKDDLSSSKKDLAILKKEANKYINRDEDSLYEAEQNKELEDLYNVIASKEESLNATAYEDKKALIEKAKALLNAKNYKQATNEMNDLFNEFKSSPRCTKAQDDELWTEFKAIKDQFNANKKAYYDNLTADLNNKKAQKENLINEAKALLDMENLKEAANKFNALLEDWKKVGFSGKDNDDALWKEFNQVRKELNEKRNARYNEMQKVYNERIAKKEELIKKAKLFLANAEFVNKEMNQIKELRNAWKEVGFAGKEKDDELWNTFNSIINKYFEEKRNYDY